MADAVAPQDPAGNREWLANRQAFEEVANARRHYEAQDTRTGEMVAYGAIEQTEQDAYRVFLLPAGDELWETAGVLIYDRLAADLTELSAKRAWLREYDTHAALISFFTVRGFVQDFHTTAFSGPAVAEVEGGWALGFHASLRGEELWLNVPDHLESGFLSDQRSRGFTRRYGAVRLTKTLV